jgi:hypothetical protein
MLGSLLNAVFSVEYLIIGILVAILLDTSIHYTKSSSRLTFLEIWGCVVIWPLVLVIFLKGLFSNEE